MQMPPPTETTATGSHRQPSFSRRRDRIDPRCGRPRCFFSPLEQRPQFICISLGWRQQPGACPKRTFAVARLVLRLRCGPADEAANPGADG